MDGILASVLIIHSHIGFDGVVTDYVPKRKYPRLSRVMNYLLKAATAAVFVGIYEFNTNDVGLTEAIRKIWTAGAHKPLSPLSS